MHAVAPTKALSSYTNIMLLHRFTYLCHCAGMCVHVKLFVYRMFVCLLFFLGHFPNLPISDRYVVEPESRDPYPI